MFKKIALVAMLAAGSLQAAKDKKEASIFATYVTTPAYAAGSFAKNTVLGFNANSEEVTSPMSNKTVLSTSLINTVSRVALLTQLGRALNAAKKAKAGEKMDAAKEVLTTKATAAAVAGTVLGWILGTEKVSNYLTTATKVKDK